MTESQRAAENAKAMAATVLAPLQAEHDEIIARLAAATGPALEQLQRMFGERLAHLKARGAVVPEPPPPTAS